MRRACLAGAVLNTANVSAGDTVVIIDVIDSTKAKPAEAVHDFLPRGAGVDSSTPATVVNTADMGSRHFSNPGRFSIHGEDFSYE